MYSTVLIPTDGSDGATEAVETGLELAARFGATVHALFVVDERFVADESDPVVEDAEREAERALDGVAELGSERGIEVERHLRRGIPHEEILRAIDEYGADVVTMGTHGRTGLDRFLALGSVTERVVRASPVHVVTVPIRAERERPSGPAASAESDTDGH